MLQPPGLRPQSLTSFGKHLCAGCGAETEGIPVGGYCDACTRRRSHRAGRIARWVAIGTTIPIAAYAAWWLPVIPGFRIGAAIGVLIWFAVVSRLAKHVALEWIR